MARKTRTRRSRRGRSFTKKAIPAVKKGLSKIGRNVTSAARSSAPAIKKGFGTIFDAISKGVDKGVSAVKGLMSKRRRRR
jgi:hypothetical protein